VEKLGELRFTAADTWLGNFPKGIARLRRRITVMTMDIPIMPNAGKNRYTAYAIRTYTCQAENQSTDRLQDAHLARSGS